MGQYSSIAQYGGKFESQQWIEIRNNNNYDTEQTIEKGKYRVIKKLTTGQQLEQYKLVFNQEIEIKHYITCFEWRLKQEYIVNTRYLLEQKITQFCSSKHAIKVYVQYIPSRLSDITDIPFPQNLYILKTCLYGFQKLFRNIGYFKIEEDLICIDTNAQIKVWFNSDLSKNYPNVDEVFDTSSALLQNKMVHQLIEISKATLIDKQNPSLVSFIFYRRKPKAINYLNQYAQYFDVQIPIYFESMIQIMNEEAEVGSQARSKGLMQMARLDKSSQIKPMFSKQSSENFISLPKSSHIQNDVSRDFIYQNHSSIPQQGYYPQNYQVFNQATPFQRSNQNSFIYGMQPPNANLSHMKTSNQYIPYDCFLQKVSFSYSNQKQKIKELPKQLQIKQIVEQEKMLELELGQEHNQKTEQKASPNYYKDEKRIFKIKSLIQQCEQDMEMSKSNYFLNKRQSQQEEPETKKRSLLSKSKSRSKHTFSKVLNAVESIDEIHAIQKERENKKQNKKNMIVVSRQDQVYRSQNSPTSIHKQTGKNITYSQINNKSISKLEKITEHPFAQFQAAGNFLTMVESNLNFANPKDPFGNDRHYASKAKSNMDWSKKYENIQIELDPQIVKDLQRYNI